MAFQENFQLNDNTPIKSCCCIPQGNGQLSAKFNKNVFFSNETVFAEIMSNNS